MLMWLRTNAQAYKEASFYVVAHQDDWQLFMGADAYNDITSHRETEPGSTGKKVVIVYTTAGNLNDDDDTKSCVCKEIKDGAEHRIPYWQVRETGAKSSVHIAAASIGSWGPGAPYPTCDTALINNHYVVRYQYKNTISYFMRLKSGQYGNWYDTNDFSVATVDGLTTYVSRKDFINTLAAIFDGEMNNELAQDKATFHFPDTDENRNPKDHHDHYIAGRSAAEAAKQLAKRHNACYPQHLYIDYDTENLPVNIYNPDVQNEAALTAVYCLALLDYNAWPEWGAKYREWNNRNYYRTATTCE